MSWRGSLAGALALAAIAALAPATASAALSISSLTTQPSATQAGSHPNFTLSLRFGGDSTPKAMTIELPPGFVGNPSAAAKCPQATFSAGACGADAAVGSTTVYVNAGLAGGGGGGGGGGGPLDPVLQPVCTLLPILCGGGLSAITRQAATPALTVPVPATGTVYNLEPNPGEPARLGIAVQPVGGLLGEIRLQSAISVRDDGDFGLTSSLDGLPTTFSGLSTQITGMDLTLNGAASGGDFVTLPTSCATATTRVSVTPYSGAAQTASASFTPTGCANVPFSPGLDVVPQTTQVDSPSGYSITLAVPGAEDPIRQSHVAGVRVVLPLGTALNPGTAATLQTCSEQQFAKGSRAAPSCPAASVVGSTSFTSPLVGTLTGTVYEGEPVPGQMLRLFVDVPGPGLRIKLIGNVDADAKTGQVTSSFSGLPPLPFTGFTLSFRGGDTGILTTPPTCGPATSTAVLVPNSGGAAAGPSSAFDVNWDGQGSACPDPLPFTPQIAASVNPSTAGASTAATTTISRADRTQRLGDMAISFPPGLLGGLGSGIGLCDLAKARAASCASDSRVGSATLVAGPGGAPLSIDGDVFLTAPPDSGALAGLAIVVPGKVGPFDLGPTVSLARIVVRKDDAGLDVTANGLPQIVGGIPLDLRQIKLQLDRKGFMRNATSCAPQALSATFTSSLGTAATATAPYQATGCDKVPFNPKLLGIVGTKTQLAKGANPAVTAVVTQTASEISTKSVTVTLPKELGIDIENLGVTCPEGQDCGTRNVVGTATAITPLLPLPLTGPVRLVTPKAGGLPTLDLQLSGLLSLHLTGKTGVTSDGRVTNTFDGIPDVPLSRFELALKGGRGGVLQNLRALRCGEKLQGTGAFVGHSGAKKTSTGSFEVCGTLKRPGQATATARVKGGALKLTVHGASRVTALRVGLPKGTSLRGKRGVSIKGRTKRTKVAVAKRTLTASRLGARTVTVTMSPRALRGAKAAAKKHRKLRVRVTMGKQKASMTVAIG